MSTRDQFANFVLSFQRMPLWRLWLSMVAVSLAMSEMIVAGMDWLLLGQVTADYLLTGMVASLLVASLVVAVVLNSSEQKHKLAADLAESEKRYRMVSDLSSDFTCSCFRKEGEYHIDWLAGSCQRLFGLSKEDLMLWEGLRSTVLADDLPTFDRNITALAPGEFSKCELRVSHTDGSIRCVRAISKVLSQADGEEHCLLYSSWQDITELKRAESIADRERFRLQTILKMASDGIHILDTDGVLVDANDAFLNMLGYDHSMIGKLRVSDWDPWMPTASFKADIDHLLAGGSRPPFETRHRRRDGVVLNVEINTSAIEVEGRRYIYAASRDITMRRREELKLLEITNELETQVTLRTRRLRAASAQLTMTEERERSMLAQELHDNLCQILAVVKIKLTSLDIGAFQPSVDPIVELVSRADQSARAIIRELSPPTLRTLGLIPALEWLAKEKMHIFGLRVHFDCVEEPKPLADGMRAVLFRSVRELLINVARHAKVSEASLSCWSDENLLRLIVCDDGCGFNTVNFDDNNLEERSFGLRSIYERLTNLGGEMEIDSSPGHGTKITLTLPYSTSAQNTPPS